MKKLIMILILLLSLLMWLLPITANSSTSEYMEFEIGAGLEEVRLQQEQLIADALEAHKKAELERLKHELRTRAEKLRGTRQGQCVIAVRIFLFGHKDRGRNEIQGWAKSLRINSQEPTVGAIVLLDTRNKHEHVAVVIDITADTILVYESNFVKAGMAGIREIPKNSPEILGYRIVSVNI